MFDFMTYTSFFACIVHNVCLPELHTISCPYYARFNPTSGTNFLLFPHCQVFDDIRPCWLKGCLQELAYDQSKLFQIPAENERNYFILKIEK